MAQRKLNKQQQKRISARQGQARKQKDDSGTNDSRHTGVVIQHHGKQAIVEDENKHLVNCKIRQNLGNIICGDRVIWQLSRDEGVIVAIKERDSVLARPDFNRKPKPFAANINQIIIVAAVKPEPSLHLLDRYLVILEKVGLPGVIVVNKTDLLTDETLAEIKNTFILYEQLGYQTIYTNTRITHGVDGLASVLQGNNSILVGQSGVGKSSIVNMLIPDLDIRTGELSQYSHGKHTTSTSVLYHLPSGGDVIDSPGIRDFGIWHVSHGDIINGFREFYPFLGQCKFNNCQHTKEPDCAIKKAVTNKIISQNRYKSYMDMLTEIDQD